MTVSLLSVTLRTCVTDTGVELPWLKLAALGIDNLTSRLMML
jgi:hypothetical protein